MLPLYCFIEQASSPRSSVFIAKNDHGRGSFVRKRLTGFAGGLGGPRRISTGLWKGSGFERGRALKGRGLQRVWSGFQRECAFFRRAWQLLVSMLEGSKAGQGRAQATLGITEKAPKITKKAPESCLQRTVQARHPAWWTRASFAGQPATSVRTS